MTSLHISRRSQSSSGRALEPFGDFRIGFGRDRSLHALYKYADLKSVSITIR